MTEQRYQAVLAMISDGETVSSMASRFGVHRTLIATMRSSHPGWGPRRLVHELGRAGVGPLPSESAVYRGVGSVEPDRPSGRPATPPQVEAVGTRDGDGAVADGRRGRVRPRGRAPGEGADRDRWVLFDRICRENGIEHLHTQPRAHPPRRARWRGSTARCAPSSVPIASSPTSRPHGPSSTGGSTTTTTTGPTRRWTWITRRASAVGVAVGSGREDVRRTASDTEWTWCPKPSVERSPTTQGSPGDWRSLRHPPC